MKSLNLSPLLLLLLPLIIIVSSCTENEVLDDKILVENEETLIQVIESDDFITFRVESLADGTDNRGGGKNATDYCNISFDINSNKIIDSEIDFGYESPTENYDICSYYFLGEESITHCAGHPTNAVFSEFFTSSTHLSTPHMIWELKIDKEELDYNRNLSFTVKTVDRQNFRTYPTNVSNTNPLSFYFNKTLTFTW